VEQRLIAMGLHMFAEIFLKNENVEIRAALEVSPRRERACKIPVRMMAQCTVGFQKGFGQKQTRQRLILLKQ
jgi:hypothetical protein